MHVHTYAIGTNIALFLACGPKTKEFDHHFQNKAGVPPGRQTSGRKIQLAEEESPRSPKIAEMTENFSCSLKNGQKVADNKRVIEI